MDHIRWEIDFFSYWFLIFESMLKQRNVSFNKEMIYLRVIYYCFQKSFSEKVVGLDFHCLFVQNENVSSWFFFCKARTNETQSICLIKMNKHKGNAFTDETNQSWKSYTQGRAKREWFKMSIDVTKIQANRNSLQQQSALYI